MSSNRAKLAQLDDKAMRDLPLDQIELLLEELAELKANVKSYDDLISTEMSRRFSGKAALLRTEAGKDTGSVRINLGEKVVVADLPKIVRWDQGLLGDLADEITLDWKEDAADYMKIEFAVDERKFSAWPPSVRKVFEPARTVKTGKPTFKIETKKGDVA